MRVKKEYLVITFDLTEQAINAQELLKSLQYDIKIIPLPEAIKAGCGLALATDKKLDANKWQEVLNQNQIEYHSIERILL